MQIFRESLVEMISKEKAMLHLLWEEMWKRKGETEESAKAISGTHIPNFERCGDLGRAGNYR